MCSVEFTKLIWTLRQGCAMFVIFCSLVVPLWLFFILHWPMNTKSIIIMEREGIEPFCRWHYYLPIFTECLLFKNSFANKQEVFCTVKMAMPFEHPIAFCRQSLHFYLSIWKKTSPYIACWYCRIKKNTLHGTHNCVDLCNLAGLCGCAIILIENFMYKGALW